MPPTVALLNHISSGILWRIFSQTGIFPGFSLHIIKNVVRISEAAMGGKGDITFSGRFFLYNSPKGSAKLRWAGPGSWDICNIIVPLVSLCSTCQREKV